MMYALSVSPRVAQPGPERVFEPAKGRHAELSSYKISRSDHRSEALAGMRGPVARRIAFQVCLPVWRGLVVQAQLVERVGEVVMGARVAGADLQRLPIGLERRFVLVERAKDGGEV